MDEGIYETQEFGGKSSTDPNSPVRRPVRIIDSRNVVAEVTQPSVTERITTQATTHMTTQALPPRPALGPVRAEWIPWPAVMVLLIGLSFAIYAGVAPDIDSHRRIFGSVTLAIWTIICSLLIWLVWSDNHEEAAWWFGLLAMTIIFIIFIVFIIFNIGAD